MVHFGFRSVMYGWSIAANGLRLCVCLPLAQSFKFTTNVDGANSTKPLLYAGTVD